MFFLNLDFNTAKKLYKDSHPETLPRKADEDEKRAAMEDWGCFLCSVCEYIGIQFNWINRGNMRGVLNANQRKMNPSIKEDLVSVFLGY